MDIKNDVRIDQLSDNLFQVWAKDIGNKLEILATQDYIAVVKRTEHKDCVVVQINPLYMNDENREEILMDIVNKITIPEIYFDEEVMIIPYVYQFVLRINEGTPIKFEIKIEDRGYYYDITYEDGILTFFVDTDDEDHYEKMGERNTTLYNYFISVLNDDTLIINKGKKNDSNTSIT